MEKSNVLATNLGFEIVISTPTVTSMGSPGLAVDFEGVNTV
jgi:hypothetical protein